MGHRTRINPRQFDFSILIGRQVYNSLIYRENAGLVEEIEINERGEMRVITNIGGGETFEYPYIWTSGTGDNKEHYISAINTQWYIDYNLLPDDGCASCRFECKAEERCGLYRRA